MNKLNPSVKASTLSVLLKGFPSITCGVELNNEYINVSLNFDEDHARILGYDQTWGVHDLNIDQYDSESPTYKELIEDNGEDVPEMPVYVSQETEAKILKQLKASLKKQFQDPMFKDTLTEAEKDEAISKIDKAISTLL